MTLNDLSEELQRHRRQLKSYLLRISANAEDAEDIIQDTFIRAQEKIGSFKGESSVKTWLFAIASNLAKDNLRVKRRWSEDVTDISREAALGDREFFQEAMDIRLTSEQGHFEIKEHITFCFTCISKSLPLEQQICLFLKEVYHFKVEEIAIILDITEAMVKYHLHTARQKMITIFDGKCALINKAGTCHQCTELNGIFNPKQSKQEELAKIQMVRDAEAGDKEHLFDLRAQIVSGIDPFESPAAELQLHHLEHNSRVMERFLAERG